MRNLKTIITTILLFLAINSLFSQTPVGQKFDCNGMPFNGYFNPLTYSPIDKVTEKCTSDIYEKGYYYDTSGKKVFGFINLNPANAKYIEFKEDIINESKIFKIKDAKELVFRTDSFLTMNGFRINEKTTTQKKCYAQFIAKINGMGFVKRYSYSNSGYSQNFFVKTEDESMWNLLPTNSKFEDYALKYFGYLSFLKEKIVNGEYDENDLLTIIKTADYYDRYQKAKPIFYDAFWQEVLKKEDAKYHALITAKVDSVWTFEYYEGDTKLYQVNYTSFYPNIKNGEFISYYPEGKTRQIIMYEENEPKEVKEFTPNGELKVHYKHVITDIEKSTKDDHDIKYIFLADSQGDNILDGGKKGSIDVHDDFADHTYTQHYDNDELIESYRLHNQDKVFQITDPDYNFRTYPLYVRFSKFMKRKEYNEAIADNAQGIILASFYVNYRGDIISAEILNELHPELNGLIDEFINEIKPSFKFDPYVKDKEKKFCEVVIPFEFSINKFYRLPMHYNNYGWNSINKAMNAAVKAPYSVNPAGVY